MKFAAQKIKRGLGLSGGRARRFARPRALDVSLPAVSPLAVVLLASSLLGLAALATGCGPVIHRPSRPAPALPSLPPAATTPSAAPAARATAPDARGEDEPDEDAPETAAPRPAPAIPAPPPVAATPAPKPTAATPAAATPAAATPAAATPAAAAPTAAAAVLLNPDAAPDGLSATAPPPRFDPRDVAPEPAVRMAYDEAIELIVHEPTGRAAPYDRCDVRFCRVLVELIDGAEKTIDFAIYGMRNQTEVFDALMRAKARGVAIRGVVDRTLDGKNYYGSTEKLVAALGTVRDDHEAEKRSAQQRSNQQDPFAFGRGPLCPRPPGFEGPLQCLKYDLGDRCLLATHASIEQINNSEAIMHHKFFVVDNKAVWSGSTNVSDSCSGGYNANLVTVARVPEIAEKYTGEFEQMWTKGRYHQEKDALDGPWYIDVGGGVKAIVLFSPQHKPITRGVLPVLKQAKNRIDVAVFYLTHKGITDELIKAHRRGVRVRIIVDATSATNGYSKHELLRVAGIPVKIEHWGGKMHMKSLVVDGHTTVTGSMNFTSAGEGGNDENTIIIESPRHAQYYEKIFQQMWEVIPNKWLEGRPHPESKDSTTACTDGVDNNHDHKADGDDPGCGPTPPPLPMLPPHFLVEKTGKSCKDAKFPGSEDDEQARE